MASGKLYPIITLKDLSDNSSITTISGFTHIYPKINGKIYFKNTGTTESRFYTSNGTIYPDVNNTDDLGAINYSYKDLYLSGDVKISNGQSILNIDTTYNSTYIGHLAGGTSTGTYNSSFGYNTGANLTSGIENTLLGALAGYNLSTTSGNVMIGFQSGYQETGSNKLYISNWSGDSSLSLIYGEFDTPLLRFNSNVIVSGHINPTTSDTYVIGTGTTQFAEAYIKKFRQVDYIEFNSGFTDGHVPGRIHWDADAETLEIDTDITDTHIQIGQEVLLKVSNKSGIDIPDGKVVYVTGAQGDKPTVAMAHAGHMTAITTIGMTTSYISDNGNGYVTMIGLVHGLNTSGYTEGSLLWLSDTTSGDTTDIRPSAPSIEYAIGIVTRSHATEGIIAVKGKLIPRLSWLSDVSVRDSGSTNDILKINSNGYWDAYPLSAVTSQNGIAHKITTITGDTTLDSTYYWVLSNKTTSDHQITLPASPDDGREYLIKKVSDDTYKTVVNGNGNLIDGDTENYIYYKYDAKGYVYSSDFGWNVF